MTSEPLDYLSVDDLLEIAAGVRSRARLASPERAGGLIITDQAAIA